MSDAERDDGEGDSVSLVRLAGARPVPSAARAAAARAHVHAAWRAGVRRRRVRATLLLAAAGLAALAVGIVGWRHARQAPAMTSAPAAQPASVVARLDAATSAVERESGSGWVRLAVGEALNSDTRVRTAMGGAGFLAADGRSVRLAARSQLSWDAPDRLTLEAGAVYVDSGPVARVGASFEVRTPRAAVRETGTQFEVRLDAQGLRVRVREGRVSAGGEEAAGGTELWFDARGVTRRAVPVHGPEWSWVLSLAPALEMDGRTLHQLAGWAAREAGWELRYADAGSERRARVAVLHGSIRGLRPDEAVLAVIPSTGLAHRLGDGVLRIGPRDSGDGR